MIPLNDTSRISNLILSKSNDDIQNVIKSGRWLLGEYTEKFRSEFAKYVGTQFCLPVANGTDALEIALRVVCNGSNGEVITVANAGGYTSTASKLVGLKPVYIDIDKESLLMDISSLEKVVSTKTEAVVVTHLYGRAVDVSKVRIELDRLGYGKVKIVEDCAQAHGAKINGKRVGSLGDIATFSFYPTKNLGAVGDAGAILTSDENLYHSALQLSQYGWVGKYNIEVEYARNSRMDEIQAAIILNLLPYLDSWNCRRREIYNEYIKAICSDSIGVYNCLDESNVVHLAIIKVNNREKFMQHMKDSGISVDVHYPILDTNQKAWCYIQNQVLTNSESELEKIVTLPCFPTMTDSEVELVCNALRSWNNA